MHSNCCFCVNDSLLAKVQSKFLYRKQTQHIPHKKYISYFVKPERNQSTFFMNVVKQLQTKNKTDSEKDN